MSEAAQELNDRYDSKPKPSKTLESSILNSSMSSKA